MTSDEWKDYIKTIHSSATSASRVYDSQCNLIDNDLSALSDKIADDSKSLNLIKTAEPILKKLSNYVLGDVIEELKSIVNTGLNAVFGPYKFDLILSESSRRAVPMLYNYKFDSWSEIRTPSGIVSFIEFIHDLYFVIKFRRNKLLLLDEQFSMVDELKIDELSKFIRLLTSEYDFCVVFVTHNPSLSAFADNHYEFTSAADGSVVTTKRK